MKPCKNCPFRKGNAWYGLYGSSPNAHSKIEALKSTDSAGVFSCHLKNPKNNVFLGEMKNNDCDGFKMMLENMKEIETYPEIVNSFNETGPDYDLNFWAKMEGYKSKLKLLDQ